MGDLNDGPYEPAPMADDQMIGVIEDCVESANTLFALRTQAQADCQHPLQDVSESLGRALLSVIEWMPDVDDECRLLAAHLREWLP